MRKFYRHFVEQGISMGKQPHLVGGGSIRSLGGWSEVKALRRIGIREKADARILGCGSFVSRILDGTDLIRKHRLANLDRETMVYKHDAEAREQNLSAQQRLELHQSRSSPLMSYLKDWFDAQFEEKKVEPNCGLGQAIKYMLNHWDELTLFLRQPGSPLDNNVCERVLKKAILNRKNALFYKTERGARVSDLYISLIHTCELCKVNPFDYLVALRENSADVQSRPDQWMPWNYKRPPV